MALQLPKRSGLAGEGLLDQFFSHKIGYDEDFSKGCFLLAYIFQYASFDVYFVIFNDEKCFGLRRGQLKFQVAQGPIKH